VSVDQVLETAAWFDGFAKTEAGGRSPLYAEFAAGVAADREMLAALCALPMSKRQPNLLLAAVRYVCGLPDGWPGFRSCYLERREEITAVILERRVQTNEPARCAPLLPALAQLPQPLALVEVGAAAGLCLLPDRYGYDYGGRTILPDEESTPIFSCRANERTPLPTGPLEVVWRAGLDLNPIDLGDQDAIAWLEMVWPDEGRRLALLRAALDVARTDPPRAVRGDLRRDLPALAAQAPSDATLVVFHTAVLAYVPDAGARHAFGHQVAALGARWISQEGRDVRAPAHCASTKPWPSNQYVIAVDRVPTAHSEVHGAWVDWL
jgi:hypothetical protein